MEEEEKRKKTPGRMGIRGSPFPWLGVIEVKSILYHQQSIVNRQSPEQAIVKNPTTNSSTWQN
jgi:hypothetical protein